MMNSANRKSVPKNSLEKKVFRVSMIGSFLLGIVLMVIFLGIYSHSLATQYIVESFALCKSTRLAVRDQGYPDGLIQDIIDRYEGLSDAERATTGSAGYREKFADFIAFSAPEAIIMFGGLTKAGDFLMKPVREAMDANVLTHWKGKVKLLFSDLKEADAAVLGASALAWEL